MIISYTRLRLKSIWNLPKFMKLSAPSIQQAIDDLNCCGGATYLGPGLTFWTATLWNDEKSLLSYMRSGAHKIAMPWLTKICSEAATTRNESQTLSIPTKKEMQEQLVKTAKFFTVQNPSKNHIDKIISHKHPWHMRIFK